MNPIVKTVLLCVGGTSLFVGSFVGVALVSGRPAHEIPLLKNLTHAPEPPHDAHPPVAVEPEHQVEGKHDPLPEAKVAAHAPTTAPAAASVLGAFVMPSPFNGDELAQMQSKLALRLEEVEVSVAEAREKRRVLDEREHALVDREKELQSLKVELDTRTKELIMRELELARDGDANAALEDKSWTELARFFGEGDADELAKKLATFEPADAAKILRKLGDERAVALVNALAPDKYKLFLDAYRRGVK